MSWILDNNKKSNPSISEIVSMIEDSRDFSGTMYEQTLNANKEIAYLKLKQEASERIENGTTFADGMDGNTFGMTFDSSASTKVIIRNGAMTMNNLTLVSKTVASSPIVSSNFEFYGKGGRKLVRLVNGWLISANINAQNIYFQKSIDFGVTWTALTNVSSFLAGNVSLVSSGNKVHALFTQMDGAPDVFLVSFDATTVPATLNNTATYESYFESVDSTQTAMGDCSLAINESGTELHAAWSSKNATYSAFNIRYSKATRSPDGKFYFGDAEQWTNFSTAVNHIDTPSVVVKNDKVYVFVLAYQDHIAPNGSNIIMMTDAYTTKRVWSDSYFPARIGSAGIYDGTWQYIQANPSAVAIPQHINGIPLGIVCVAWEGFDAAAPTTKHIRFRRSLDEGVTWSEALKIVPGSSPSLTSGNGGMLYITYEEAGIIKQITSTNHGVNWSAPVTVGTGINASSLHDPTLNTTKPLTLYRGSTSVTFTGQWLEPSETPSLTGRAVYTLPSTNFVGAFVKKSGNVTIDAYINDVLMDEELENNEYMFMKDIIVAAPVKLRLELSRTSLTGGDNDKVTRILGGIK